MNLTLELIMKIKRMLKSKIFSTEESWILEHNISDISNFFNVSRQAVYNIKFKRTYKDVETMAQKIRKVGEFPEGSFDDYWIYHRDDSEHGLRE